MKAIKYSILAATLVGMAGCGGSDDDSTGTLSLAITDAPIDTAQSVFVQFSGVEVHSNSEGAQQFDFAEAKQIDLLNLQGSASEPLLEGVELEAGAYQWLRLKVDTEGDLDTYIILDDGSSHELTVPSGAKTGLKMNRGFDLSVNGSVDFTVDFDLRKSITETSTAQGNLEYKLRPTLRITDNSEIGHIKGTVDGTFLTDNCGGDSNPAVYIFEGSDVSPDDEGSATSPLTTSLLNEQSQYEIGFVDAGNYTLALTCIADIDVVDVDNDEFGNDAGDGFVQTANVAIESKKTATYNFE